MLVSPPPETEDVPTAAMESAATQTSSMEHSRKCNPDLVLVDNLPPANGDDCKSIRVCKFVCEFENRIDNQFCSAMFSPFLPRQHMNWMNQPYLKFCEKCDLQPFPTSETALMLFVAYLQLLQRTLSPGTLAAIQYHQISQGLPHL